MVKYGAIFDCDGTLLDSMPEWRSLEGVAARLCNVVLAPEDMDHLATFTVPEMAEYVAARSPLGLSAQQVEQGILDHMLVCYQTRVEEKPGALAYVRCLHEAGIPICVASSSSMDFLEAGLSRTGILPYVDRLFSSQDLHTTKRKPDMYLMAAEHMGTLPENTWVFEDALYAVKCAKGAGFRVVGVFDDPDVGSFEGLTAEADMVIRHYDELQGEFPPKAALAQWLSDFMSAACIRRDSNECLRRLRR